MPDTDKLSNLHDLVAEILTEKILSGEAKASDLAVAVRFLKDNNIDCMASPDNKIGKLSAVLPFPPHAGEDQEIDSIARGK